MIHIFLRKESIPFKIARPKFNNAKTEKMINNTKTETMIPLITTNTKDSILLSKKYEMTDKNNSTNITNRIIDIGLICT